MINADCTAQRQVLCLVAMATAIELSVCKQGDGKRQKEKWETWRKVGLDRAISGHLVYVDKIHICLGKQGAKNPLLPSLVWQVQMEAIAGDEKFWWSGSRISSH